MTDATPILVVAGLAALAYFSLPTRETEEPPASAGPAPGDRSGPIGGALDNIIGGIGQGIGGFFGAAGEGIGRAVGTAAESSGLEDKDSDFRRNIRKGGEKWQLLGSKLTGGLIKDPTKKRKEKRKQQHADTTNRMQLEAFAARAHQLMSRSDVREWVISSAPEGSSSIVQHQKNLGMSTGNVPTIFVYFNGSNVPHKIAATYAPLDQRIAWVAEPVVRALGVFVQRGRRLDTPFRRHNPPAFDDRNPYAPLPSTVTAQNSAIEEFTTRDLKRKGKALASKDVQRALAAEQAAAAEE